MALGMTLHAQIQEDGIERRNCRSTRLRDNASRRRVDPRFVLRSSECLSLRSDPDPSFSSISRLHL